MQKDSPWIYLTGIIEENLTRNQLFGHTKLTLLEQPFVQPRDRLLEKEDVTIIPV